MNNLAIKNKLLVCFSILFAAMLVVGALSVSKLGALSDTAQHLGVERRKMLTSTKDIDTAMSDYRVAEATHILSTEPDQIRNAERDLAAERTLVDDRIAFLKPRLVIPQMQALVAQFEGEWADYRAKSEKMLELSRLNKNAEALALFRANRRTYDKVSATSNAMQEFQSSVMDRLSAEARDSYIFSRNVIVAAVVVTGLLIVVLLITLVRAIATPLGSVTQVLGELGKGNLSVSVTASDRRDEVGALTIATQNLRDQLFAAERAKEEQADVIVASIGTGLSQLAEGDLTARIDANLAGKFAPLQQDFNRALEALQTAMAKVARATSGIHTGSSEIRQASDDLSRRTEQQAASLEETAAAMDQITATVKQTAADAGRANQAVSEARADAEDSGRIVRRAVEAMGGIERSSAEISEIISVIDGIAFQTNLLALNAGVEAARAGDAGKGFAVVASEVRALAQRSAEAAKDVKDRITASSEQVGAGVEMVGETGKALERIIGRITSISELVEGIAHGADQQSAGLTQVNTAVTEMDGVTQQNAAMVEEATAAARSLAGEADELAHQIGRFRLEADSRVRTSRGAATAMARTAERKSSSANRGPALRAVGNAALAAEADDWSEF
jgi:methyl-accepting chemotaxis protein